MSLAPFVLIGCGGSGVLSVRHVRDEVKARLRVHGIEKIPDAWQFIGIDATAVQADLTEATPLPPLDYLQLRPGASVLADLDKMLLATHPPALRRSYVELVGWRPDPQAIPTNIEIGLTNHAVGRVVGTIALQAPQIRRRLEAAINAAEASGPELNSIARKMNLPVGGLGVMAPNVLVITSMAGGCGSGISLDVVDLLKHLGGNGIQPILISYGTDIFEHSQQYMTSNNLAYLAELLNSVWSENGGRAGLFPAPFGLPTRRGPRATFVLGRRNLDGVDLQGSRNVYRSVGITIAGWLTSPTVRQRFQDYVVGNWTQFPQRLGGYGFADSVATGEVSSFGSATLAVGRKRFRDYARKYILRDLYEFHFRGFRKVATSVFGEDGDRGIDVAIRSRLVEKFLPEIATAFGLSNAFDKQMGIISDGSAQISDALLSVSHLQRFSGDVGAAITVRLPGESLKGAEWSSIIHDEIMAVKRQLLIDATGAYRAREEEWLRTLVKRVMKQSNTYLTRLSLPVMIDVSQSIAEQVGRTATEFKGSARVAEEKSREFALNANNELADVASNNLMKDSPQVRDAIELFAASIGQELKAQLSLTVAQTLEQVIVNLLQPLNSAFRRAKDGVDEMADSSRAGEAAIITKWPEGSIVPRSFQPSPIEHLLESHGEWPAIIERLLRTAEPAASGESTADAVRRGIADGVEMDGEIGANDLRPLLWTRNDAPLEFVRTQPLAIDLALDLLSLEERVDRWLGKPGRELGDYLREGLGQYLKDPLHPDHAMRLRRFREKFQSALEQASPFVTVDRVYFGTVYPGADLGMTFTVEPIPFQDGHPAHTIAEELIRNRVQNVDGVVNFSDQDRESVTVSCFFDKPMFPGVISSMLDEIAQHGIQYGGNPDGLRGWLDFKRGRTLDEFIPLPPNVTRALIRGFAVGRLTGLIKLPSQPEDVASIAGDGGSLRFPSPSYASLSNQLTSLLLSFTLCFLTVSRNRQRAFDAYARMFRLGVVAEGGNLGPAQYAVGGELAEFLENGKTVIAAIDTPQCRGSDRESRIGDAIAYLDDNIRRLTDLANQPYTGNEVVSRLVTWSDENVPVREIAPMIIEEFQRVKMALQAYLTRGSGDRDRQ
jgi:hypothetical protein